MDVKKYDAVALSRLLGRDQLGQGDGALGVWRWHRGSEQHGLYPNLPDDADKETCLALTGDLADGAHMNSKCFLPVPCTLAELAAFDRATGLFSEGLEAGDDTDALIEELTAKNADAGTLAHALIYGAPVEPEAVTVDAAPQQKREVEPVPDTPPAPATELVVGKHTIKRRADPLGAVIKLAQESSASAEDWTSVWAALVALAQSDSRPAPLVGYTEGEGVKYQSDSGSEPVKFLSREAFRKRCARN